MSSPYLCVFYYVQEVSVTYISWSLICNRNVVEDEGITVIFGGSARLANTFEQLPHGSILPLTDEPLAGSHVDGLSLQLEVLQQDAREKEMTDISTFEWKTTGQ